MRPCALTTMKPLGLPPFPRCRRPHPTPHCGNVAGAIVQHEEWRPALEGLTMRDPYDVLGVSKSASAAEIKSAFRRQAKKLRRAGAGRDSLRPVFATGGRGDAGATWRGARGEAQAESREDESQQADSRGVKPPEDESPQAGLPPQPALAATLRPVTPGSAFSPANTMRGPKGLGTPPRHKPGRVGDSCTRRKVAKPEPATVGPPPPGRRPRSGGREPPVSPRSRRDPAPP